jgi:hypothetical protein
MELVEANPNDDELRAKLFECQCGSHFMKAFKWVNDDMLQVELFSNAQEEYKEVVYDLYFTKDQALELSDSLREFFNVKTINSVHDPEEQKYWPTECG